VTVILTYGVSAQSLAAALGIALSLAFAALVGSLAVGSAALDGRSSDLGTVLSQTNGAISLQGWCWPGWSSAPWACSRTWA
jgi:hypothetical protein